MFHASIPRPPLTDLRDAQTVKPSWRSRHWPEALAAATAILFALLYRNSIPEPDVAWQLWTGHQIRMGARLYVDIIETNPPLWFWEAVPLDWAGSVLGIASHVLLVGAVGLAAALSVWSTGRLTSHLPAPWRATLLVYATLTLLVMPMFWMGQREQLMLIAALPYAALAAARRAGRHVPPHLAIGIGMAVSLAFALKHYFLVTPALIELWLLVSLRRGYRPIRPETAALALMALLYAGAVMLVTPQYLTDIVPLNRIAYTRMGASGAQEMIRPPQYFWLIAAVPLLLELKALRRAPLAAALTLSTLGFACGWLIQFKGFPYHSIPTTGCLMLATLCLAIEQRPRLRLGTLAAIPTIVLMPLGVAVWQGHYDAPFAPFIRPLLADIKPQDSVAFVTASNVFSWPDTLYRPAVYPSRHYFMWVVAAGAADRGRRPALARYARAAIEDTAQDYRCVQPVRIIFDQVPFSGTDMETLFLRNPSFARLMTHYHRIGRRGQFDMFQKTAPFPAPPASACRRGV